MRSIKMLLIAILAIVSITMYAQTKPKAADKTSKPVVVLYTCPMHPGYITDKPGKCPKCGMTLVKKQDNTKDSTASKKAPMKM